MNNCKIRRDRRAERKPDKARLLQVQFVEQCRQVFHVRIGTDWWPRSPEAAQVIANDPVLPGEQLKLRIPHPSIQLSPMNQYHRWSLAFGFVVDAVDLRGK